MTSSGRHSSKLVERRLAFGRRAHLVALAAQDGPQHARDLRLVVDDQHASISSSGIPSASPSSYEADAPTTTVRRLAASAAGARQLPGRVIITAVPPDRVARPRIQMRPACASTSRRAIDRPRPMPARLRIVRLAAGHAKELLEHPLAQGRRNARPLVCDLNRDLPRVRAGRRRRESRCPPARTCWRCRAACKSLP